jgi:hypothetical protein
MKPFVKGAIVSIGAQIALCIVLVLITYLLKADFVSGILLYVYYPTVYGIWKFGSFTGGASFFMSIFLGFPLGILIYGIISGCIFNYFKKYSRNRSSL